MVTTRAFGTMPDGDEVIAYTVTNRLGASVTILNMGGIIQSLNIPDRKDTLTDIVCGFDTVEGYLTGGGYHGALIGRYANRIAGGKFTLNDTEYTLVCNEKGIIHLHGGNVGFNQKLWKVDVVEREDETRLVLEYVSPDGEEGYPGRLKVTVTYTFTDANVLRIRYEAFTDKDTICNLTNHTYFNLSGYASCDIRQHRFFIDADRLTEVNDDLLPTGREIDVAGTGFDFRRFREMTENIDHNYVLNHPGTFRKAAEVREPIHGRAMEIWTDMPGMQLYTANMMDGDVPFKGGVEQRVHTAFAVETQFAPDSPNQPSFPSCVLRKGDIYDYTTEFRFKVV